MAWSVSPYLHTRPWASQSLHSQQSILGFTVCMEVQHCSNPTRTSGRCLFPSFFLQKVVVMETVCLADVCLCSVFTGSDTAELKTSSNITQYI